MSVEPGKEQVSALPKYDCVEIQIGESEPFEPDGFWGALYFVGENRMHIHYVMDGVDRYEIYKTGYWTWGTDGKARVFVTNKI